MEFTECDMARSSIGLIPLKENKSAKDLPYKAVNLLEIAD